MKYRFLTEGKDGGKAVERVQAEKSPWLYQLRSVALAHLANTTPIVRVKATEQPTLSQTIERRSLVSIVSSTHRVQRAVKYMAV